MVKRCKREPAEPCLDRYARNNLDLAGNAGNDEYSCFFSENRVHRWPGPLARLFLQVVTRMATLGLRRMMVVWMLRRFLPG